MMEDITITVIKYTCERCGGTWTIPKGTKTPSICLVQTCRSPYWNRQISRPKASKIVKSSGQESTNQIMMAGIFVTCVLARRAHGKSVAREAVRLI